MRRKLVTLGLIISWCKVMDLSKEKSLSVIDDFQSKFPVQGKKFTNRSSFSLSPLLLAACGGGGGDAGQNTPDAVAFPVNYKPPEPDYSPPSEPDPNYEILKSTYVEPYWVAALEMDRTDLTIEPILESADQTLVVTFPDAVPAYDLMEIRNWEPANEKMISAARDIFANLGAVLDVTFVEMGEATGSNVIAISRSYQPGSSGFSYFPNPDYEIGMDVFISTNYDAPKFTSGTLTNYDYEVLVHEIGHALGLKHPFAAQGGNTATLSGYEDQTRFTVMSYDDNAATFDGTMRDLDWMALTKYYGVNPDYNGGDDTYSFSSRAGTFIIDGGGDDTIDTSGATKDVTLDLRPGAHSFVGSQNKYVTAANQLTISHGSEIENVITGGGDDTVIATDVANEIATGSGDDIIFAGGGLDLIRPGTGSDRVDLSEETQSADVVVLNASTSDAEFDIIYGFAQGAFGDVLDLSQWGAVGAKLLPLVVTGAAPSANFGGGILRVIGDALSTSEGLSSALAEGGELSQLILSSGSNSIIITSASQGTGEDQCVYSAVGLAGGGVEVSQLALLQGNALDIDEWHADNFIVIA